MVTKSHFYGSAFISRTSSDPLPARRPLGRWLKRLFLKHPHEAGETYLAHLRFTFRMSGHIVLTGIILLVHGTLPFLFTKTASSRIAVMNRIMKERLAKLAEAADEQFDI